MLFRTENHKDKNITKVEMSCETRLEAKNTAALLRRHGIKPVHTCGGMTDNPLLGYVWWVKWQQPYSDDFFRTPIVEMLMDYSEKYMWQSADGKITFSKNCSREDKVRLLNHPGMKN